MTSSASTQDQQERFHKLMESNRDTALVFLSAQLDDLMANTDEALMDFAEQAESNAMQGRFYEAISSVRKQRSQMEQLFREAVHEGFDLFGLESSEHFHEFADDDTELSLIGQDEMEESVATENLIIRARDTFHSELHALSQRLAVLNGGPKIPDEDIPTSPRHLVSAFKHAMVDLNIDMKAKIVLYALYEKFVLKNLKGLYDEQNSNLKQAGILPNLRPSVSMDDIRHAPHAARPQSSPAESEKPDVPGHPPHHEAEHGTTHPQHGAAHPHTDGGHAPPMATGSDGEANASLGEELFGTILDLMAAKRTGAPAPYPRAEPGAAAGLPPHQVPSAAGGAAPGSQPGSTEQGDTAGSYGPAVSSNLISAIDNIRPTTLGEGHGVLGDLEALPQIAVDPQFLDKLKGVLREERQEILSQVDEEEIQGIDSDTIDLVGMLFEYMLNDPLLPNVAKALLSHLHTPYLKLALIDRQLLVDSEHPARLLLDMLVEAGGQWVYENDIKRGIYPHMQRTVERVLQEFSDNEELFPELVRDFRSSMEEQRRRAEAIENRSRETVKGREKLQVAKMHAAREMQARVEMTPMPKCARRFLTQAWSDRLVFILLRQQDGEASDEWTQALQIADDLVWLFDPSSTDAGDAEIRNTAERIYQAIEDALDTLGGYHQHYLQELYSFLQDPDTIATWRADLELSEMVDSVLLDSDHPAEQDSALARSIAEESQARPEETAPPVATPEQQLTQEERDMLSKLQTLKFGTWFEFNHDSDKPRQLKLSWLSPLTSSCMFVDRSGVQAEVKSLEAVAQALVAGHTTIIPKPRHQFVERALLAIKNTLQRSMEATN